MSSRYKTCRSYAMTVPVSGAAEGQVIKGGNVMSGSRGCVSMPLGLTDLAPFYLKEQREAIEKKGWLLHHWRHSFAVHRTSNDVGGWFSTTGVKTLQLAGQPTRWAAGFPKRASNCGLQDNKQDIWLILRHGRHSLAAHRTTNPVGGWFSITGVTVWLPGQSTRWEVASPARASQCDLQENKQDERLLQHGRHSVACRTTNKMGSWFSSEGATAYREAASK